MSLFLSLIKSGINYQEPTNFYVEKPSYFTGSKSDNLVQVNPTDHSHKGAITVTPDGEENPSSDFWSSQELHTKAEEMLKKFSIK